MAWFYIWKLKTINRKAISTINLINPCIYHFYTKVILYIGKYQKIRLKRILIYNNFNNNKNKILSNMLNKKFVGSRWWQLLNSLGGAKMIEPNVMAK